MSIQLALLIVLAASIAIGFLVDRNTGLTVLAVLLIVVLLLLADRNDVLLR